MNFLRLPDPLLLILFENEEILAFDKPYGINAHTNDSKIGQTEFIQDGLIEILEKQLGQKLHIIHRLDQTTSGVIIFGKSPEAAKKYAAFFFDRHVQKTYRFITSHFSDRIEIEVDQDIIHKGKELSAQTRFARLKKSARFALWEAHPYTGRNHQIRIHAQVAGIPLLGDVKYGGHPYPFLCLHNQQIEFPNGIVIRSQPPAYFENLSLLEDSKLARVIFETDRRQRLFHADSRADQSLRLVHNKNDKEDLGYTLDQFGSALVLSWYGENWLDSDRDRFAKFARLYGHQRRDPTVAQTEPSLREPDRQPDQPPVHRPIFVRLMHNRGKDPLIKSQFLIEPSQAEVHASEGTSWRALENETAYEIRTNSGQSFGLFLDQRLQRHWVRSHASGKTVLNLFSYTCGFSVVAALGGAEQVVSVDTNKNVLNWGKKNFELNGVPMEAHRFFCRDSLTFLDQCMSKQEKFDLVICDPPSFSRGDKGVFKIENSLDVLISKCLRCLKPHGDLLFSTNSENLYVDDIRRAILRAQMDLKLAHLEIHNIPSALDFELPDKPSILKSFLIRLA